MCLLERNVTVAPLLQVTLKLAFVELHLHLEDLGEVDVGDVVGCGNETDTDTATDIVGRVA